MFVCYVYKIERSVQTAFETLTCFLQLTSTILLMIIFEYPSFDFLTIEEILLEAVHLRTFKYFTKYYFDDQKKEEVARMRETGNVYNI